VLQIPATVSVLPEQDEGEGGGKGKGTASTAADVHTNYSTVVARQVSRLSASRKSERAAKGHYVSALDRNSVINTAAPFPALLAHVCSGVAPR